MTFDYNISVPAIVLLSVALIGVIYICSVYLHRLSVVRRQRQLGDGAETSAESSLPRASVVVTTNNDAEQLEETLPKILSQDYPGRFEVIVVNDGTPDETDMVVTRLKNEFPNLYLTFVPDSTRNISRHKLAIQLGIKAAKGDVVVITDASVRVASDHWLEQMVRPFTDEGVEVVLGYNYLNLPDKPFAGRLITAFDCAADAATWLSAAIGGHPYRGCGNNIAYCRDLYFRNNGFHSSFNLRDGDDDLFVNEITAADNTRVVLSNNTLGIYDSPAKARKHYKRFRLSHAFTGRTLPKRSRTLMAIGEWLLWIVPICALCGAYLCGVTNLFGWTIAAILLLTMYIAVTLAWRKTIVTLGGPKMCLTIPTLAALRPMRNIIANLRSHSSKNGWYTWQ